MSHTPEPATAVDARREPGAVFLTFYVLAQFGAWLGILGPAILSLFTRLSDLYPPSGPGMTTVGALAIVSGIGAIAAALANPFIGRLSDRTTSRWGMRTPWIAISAVIFTVGILTVAFGPGELPVLVIGWMLAQIGFNGILAVYTAVLPDQIPERIRGMVSALSGLSQNVAGLAAVWIVGMFAAGTIQFNAAGDITGGEPSSPLRFVVPIGIAVVTAILLIIALGPIDRRLDRRAVEPYSLRVFFGSFVFNPRTAPDFSWAWISRFCFMLGIAYLLVYQAPYTAGHLKFEGAELDAVVLWGKAVMVVGAVIFGLFAGKLSDRFRRRKIFVAGSALLYGISLLFLSAAAPDHSGLTVAMIGFLIGGIAQGIYFGIDLALVTDVLPNRTGDAAKDLGVFNIASAGPQFIAPFIAPFFLSMTIFGDGTGTNNYAALFVFAAIFSILGALLVLPIRAVK